MRPRTVVWTEGPNRLVSKPHAALHLPSKPLRVFNVKGINQFRSYPRDSINVEVVTEKTTLTEVKVNGLITICPPLGSHPFQYTSQL
ncbi:hypothetical protein J6590_034471 [Homalodisca vitripennis]|nr:hypothetical protein J6590_034471 [Homalodisca vitripennis]